MPQNYSQVRAWRLRSQDRPGSFTVVMPEVPGQLPACV
jgi:hypothetical protein